MSRYEWTPASEPPSDGLRMVLVWISYAKGHGEWGWRWRGDGSPFNAYVTHWRDVEPPNSSATITGSTGEGKK